VRIRAELVNHGVDGAAAAELLRNADIDWAGAAQTVRRKRFGPDVPKDYAERARQARFLEYRGFGGAEIRAALGGDPAE
jgi:regulatory protein